MDANILQGTNPQLSAGSPVQQPLNQQSDFLGFPTFKDWFDSWMDSLYGPTGSKSPIGGQVNPQRDLGLIAENKSYNPNESQSNDEVYDWIYEAIEKAKTNNEENWYRQAKWDYDRYLEEVKRVEAREDSSYQRAVEDLKKAGINPLLAFNSLSGADSSSVSPSGSSYINNNSLIGSLLNTIMSDKKIGIALLQVFTGIIEKILPSAKFVGLFK